MSPVIRCESIDMHDNYLANRHQKNKANMNSGETSLNHHSMNTFLSELNLLKMKFYAGIEL